MINGSKGRKRSATRAEKPNRDEDLAAYVRRKRTEHNPPLSFGDIHERSGKGISKGYLSQIENRAVLGESLTIERLRSLAVGLGVSYEEIVAVASRPANLATQSTS